MYIYAQYFYCSVQDQIIPHSLKEGSMVEYSENYTEIKRTGNPDKDGDGDLIAGNCLLLLFFFLHGEIQCQKEYSLFFSI